MAKKITIDIEVNGKMQKATLSAKKLRNALDGVDEAQTNAGKSARTYDRNTKGAAKTTSNSTKEFSKMAQGMGGLVGAYATVAASVFAVSAAFQFFKTAADLSALTSGQEIFASRTGTSMKLMTANIQEATGGLVAFREAAQAAAIGQAAGLTADQMERLGKVAKNAGTILGRDVTDSFNRLTRGAIKAEPELLDELGIIIRINDAAEMYARTVNKNAQDLTQFEKSQAVVNAVLEQGESKFQDIGNSVNQVAKFGAAFQNTFKKLSEPVADVANFIAGALQDSILAVSAVMGILGLNIVKAFAPAGPALKNTAEEGINARKRLMDAAQTETDSVIAGEIRKGQFTEKNLKYIEKAAAAKTSKVMNLSKMERAAIERDLAIIRAQNLKMTMHGKNVFSRMITGWRIQMLMFEAEYGKGLGRMKFATAAFTAGFSRLLGALSVAGIMVMLVELGKQFRKTFLITDDLRRSEEHLESLNRKYKEQVEEIEKVRASLQPATSELNKFVQLFGILANYNLNPLRESLFLVKAELKDFALDVDKFETQLSVINNARPGMGPEVALNLDRINKHFDLQIVTMGDLNDAIEKVNLKEQKLNKEFEKTIEGSSGISKAFARMAFSFSDAKGEVASLGGELQLLTQQLNTTPVAEAAGAQEISNYLQSVEKSIPLLRSAKEDIEEASITIELPEGGIDRLAELLGKASASFAGNDLVKFAEDAKTAEEFATALADALQDGLKQAAVSNSAFSGLANALAQFGDASQKFLPKNSDFLPLYTALDESMKNLRIMSDSVEGLQGQTIADILAPKEGKQGLDEQQKIVQNLVNLVSKLNGTTPDALKRLSVEELINAIKKERDAFLRSEIILEQALTTEKIRQVNANINATDVERKYNGILGKRNEAYVNMLKAQDRMNKNNRLNADSPAQKAQFERDKLAADLAEAEFNAAEAELDVATQLLPIEQKIFDLRNNQQALNVEKEILSARRKMVDSAKQLLDLQQKLAQDRFDLAVREAKAKNPFLDDERAQAKGNLKIQQAFVDEQRAAVMSNFNLKLKEIENEYALLDAKRLLMVEELRASAIRLKAQGETVAADRLSIAAENLAGINFDEAKTNAQEVAAAVARASLFGLDKLIRDAELAVEALEPGEVVMRQAAEAFRGGLKDAVGGVFDALTDKTKNAADALRNAAKSILTSIRDSMAEQFIVNPIMNAVGSLFGEEPEADPAKKLDDAISKALDSFRETTKKAHEDNEAAVVEGLKIARQNQLDLLIAAQDDFIVKLTDTLNNATVRIEHVHEGFPEEDSIPTTETPASVESVITKDDPITTGTSTHTNTSTTGRKQTVTTKTGSTKTTSVPSRKPQTNESGGLAGELEGAIGNAMKEGADYFENAGLEMFEKGSLDFAAMGQGLISEMASSLLSPLKDALGGAAKSFFSNFAWAGGGRYGNVFESYGTGGIARGREAGYPAMLHGTEAVVPLPNNNKIPVDIRGGMGNQNNVTVNVNVESGTSSTEGASGDNMGSELGRAVAGAVQAELHNQKRSGGILNPYGVS